MDIADIEAGQSYACKFKIRTFVDKEGIAVDTRTLAPGEAVVGGTPGEYEGFGYIVKRDADKRLVEVMDPKLEREWVVNWNDTWDVDVIEWVDKND